jgi:hypothetical protein
VKPTWGKEKVLHILANEELLISKEDTKKLLKSLEETKNNMQNFSSNENKPDLSLAKKTVKSLLEDLDHEIEEQRKRVSVFVAPSKEYQESLREEIKLLKEKQVLLEVEVAVLKQNLE